MAWLLRGDEVLASLEVARGVRGRGKGLLGRDDLDGAILLAPAKSVHTIRMRFPIDVAFVDRDLVVLDVVTMARNRISAVRWRAHGVIEARAGAFAHWDLQVGDRLEVRE